MSSTITVRGVAVVTGASGGIGRAYVKKLIEAGARVAMVDIDADGLKELSGEVDASDAQSFWLDQADVGSIPDCFNKIEADLGPIRILVNNAAVSNMQDAFDFTESDYDRLVDINQKGPFFCAQEAARRMIAAGDGGRIVNIASAASVRVIDGNSVYGMTKAALMFMTEAVSKEWGPQGVNVNCICPGYIDTPMNDHIWKTDHGKDILRRLPRGRLGSGYDVAQLVAFLCSEEAHFINGATISVDDGLQHLFPF